MTVYGNKYCNFSLCHSIVLSNEVGFQNFISGVEMYIMWPNQKRCKGITYIQNFPASFLVSLTECLHKVVLGLYPDSVTQIYFRLSYYFPAYVLLLTLNTTLEMCLLNISLIDQCQNHLPLSNHIWNVVNSVKNFDLVHPFDLYWLHSGSGIFIYSMIYFIINFWL